MNSRKVQKLRSHVDLIQDAQVDALEQIGREIELHLEKMADSMIECFWLMHKEVLLQHNIIKDDLNFTGTEFWKGFKKFLTDKSQNNFIRDKLSLTDYLAKYLRQYYEIDNNVRQI